MTARDRAVEFVHNTAVCVSEHDEKLLANQLLASEFCSDPVRELVRTLFAYAGHTMECDVMNECTCGFESLKENELLRKIVEAE